jgi:hypothetical protein
MGTFRLMLLQWLNGEELVECDVSHAWRNKSYMYYEPREIDFK